MKIIYLTNLDSVKELLFNLNENDHIMFSHGFNLSPDLKRLHFWKTIGLLITDGEFRCTLRKKKAALFFSSLSLETAIAAVKTLLQLNDEIVVKVIVKRRKIRQTLFYKVRVLLRKSSRDIDSIRRDMYLYIREMLQDPVSVLSRLSEDDLCALFAGIIDGDGHIGKSYISVSYEIKTLKGQLIHRILDYLHNRGYIKIGEYAPRKRERFFTISNYNFLIKLQKLVYHPLRHKKLKLYLSNYSKNYICGFSVEELKQLLSIAHSAYIDYRKPPRRSKILVIYIKKDDFIKVKHIWLNPEFKPKPIINNKRVMIKVTTKCSEELSKILQNKKIQQEIKPEIISRIKDYLTTTLTEKI